MKGVRAFTPDDIETVGTLRRRCFAQSAHDDDALLHAQLRRVFFETPWPHEDFPSLVYESAEQGVTGFLGVVPRPVRHRGKRLWMAVPTQFMVDPARKGTQAIALTRALLSGKQDLSYADQCNAVTRGLWQHLGFHTLLANSLSWIRPLRPLRHGMQSFAGTGATRVIARALRPAASLVDLAMRWGGETAFTVAPPRLEEEDLTPDALLDCIGAHQPRNLLVADSDRGAWRWLVDAVGGVGSGARLRAGSVRDPDTGNRAWFLYHPRAGAAADTLAVGGHDDLLESALSASARRALADGATALQGRVQTRLLEVQQHPPFLLARRGPWTVVNTSRPELLAVMLGGAFDLSRLDAEGWIDL